MGFSFSFYILFKCYASIYVLDRNTQMGRWSPFGQLIKGEHEKDQVVLSEHILGSILLNKLSIKSELTDTYLAFSYGNYALSWNSKQLEA